MYKRAMAGYKKALGPEHTSTLTTVNNLGNLYQSQGKLAVAKAMYERALAGYEKALRSRIHVNVDNSQQFGQSLPVARQISGGGGDV